MKRLSAPPDVDRRCLARSRLGGKLAQARLDRGWDQAEAAKRMGITRPMLCLYETGQQTPTLSTFGAMRRTLGVTADVLLAWLEEAVRIHRRRKRMAA